MTLTIELAPELEARLRQVASRESQDPTAFLNSFVQTAIKEKLQSESASDNGHTGTRLPPQPSPLSDEEHERLLDELAAIGDDIPPTDESITYSREDIYFDHD